MWKPCDFAPQAFVRGNYSDDFSLGAVKSLSSILSEARIFTFKVVFSYHSMKCRVLAASGELEKVPEPPGALGTPQ